MTGIPSQLPGAPSTLATMHDVALLDLDGVVYIGEHAVPGAAEALHAARVDGMRLAFVTNNAGRPPEEVAAHLTALGIPAAPEEVVTSAQAGADLLAQALPPMAPVLAVGGPGVALALSRAGLTPLRADDPAAADARAVLQGFGRDVAWTDLAAAALAVQRGATWILTNPDATLPVPGGRAPGNGSLARAVEAAAGRAPDAIAGKPHPTLMRASIDRADAQAPLVVGDRLDTDIEGAVRSGIPSLLVLTGITDIETLLQARAGERPDYIGADLGALCDEPVPTGGRAGPQRLDDRWERARSSAWIDQGVLRVSSEGDWLDTLACACAAAWDGGTSVRVAEAAEQMERARREGAAGPRTVDP